MEHTQEHEMILIGSLFELVIMGRTEEEQLDYFMQLAEYWHEKGYKLTSGNVAEGKVDELWAVKLEASDIDGEKA